MTLVSRVWRIAHNDIVPIGQDGLSSPLQRWHAFVLTLLAAAGYWIAFSRPVGAAAIFVALPCLCALGRLRTSRQAFYGGVATGMAMYAPHLWFFHAIFGPAALFLWAIAGAPIGVFLLLLNLAHRRLGRTWALWLTPIFWTGVEYFRSELWHLRFAWLLPGQAAALLPGVRMECLGVYGLGFLYCLAAALVVSQFRAARVIGVVASLVLAILMYVPALPPDQGEAPLHVAGVQLEFPTAQNAADLIGWLSRIPRRRYWCSVNTRFSARCRRLCATLYTLTIVI
jgi:hypothetical protein